MGVGGCSITGDFLQQVDDSCRDSSVGRASDRRSEGPRLDPGSRHSLSKLGALSRSLLRAADISSVWSARRKTWKTCQRQRLRDGPRKRKSGIRGQGELQRVKGCGGGCSITSDSLQQADDSCRDSSVGRASDRRSEGPQFDPGSRQLVRTSTS